ncbi:MAG: hypothetical protein M1816_006362 [Peltula sp. TS41687]|nr:MAG: hypothetical protein M1816_006362 [Peltula sp. TS41687]
MQAQKSGSSVHHVTTKDPSRDQSARSFQTTDTNVDLPFSEGNVRSPGQVCQDHFKYSNKRRFRRAAVTKHVYNYRVVKTGDGSAPEWQEPLQMLLESTPVSSAETEDTNQVRFITPTEKVLRPLPHRRADEIPRPRKWTRRTFSAYIYDLCNSCPPRVVRRNLYQPDGQQHQTLVTRMLVEVFLDPEAQGGLNTAAFNMALEYLEKHNQVPTIRRVFVELEELGLRMNVKTFNIMLRGAAMTRDISNFIFVLRIMLDRRLTPTGETWVAFLMLFESTPIKMKILECMDTKGLLQNLSTMKDALGQVIDGALDGWLNRGWRPENFVDYMDRVWGDAWLSTSVANRVLNELGRRRLIPELLAVWETLPRRGVIFDSVSVNTILQHSVHRGKLHEVVQVICQAEERSPIEFDEATYEILWNLARRRQLYNVARVVWRYACTKARLSYKMEYQVYKSLLGDSCRPLTTLLARWDATAAKVAVGVDLSEAEQSSIFKTCEWIDNGKPRDGETIAQMKEVLRRDMASYRFIRHSEPFGRMLQSALELDEAWLRAGEETKSVAWKVSNALRIPTVLEGILLVRG